MTSTDYSSAHPTTPEDFATMMKSEKHSAQFKHVQYNILASSIGGPPRTCPKRRRFLIRLLLLLVVILAVTGVFLILFAQLLPGPVCMLFYQNGADICSSKQLTALCKYEGRCFRGYSIDIKVPHAVAPAVKPVGISVYYETYCPDSQQFIVNQLYPTWKLIHSIMNVTLVPYGKAHEKKSGDGWKFTCQHGVDECKGNMIQTCALYLQKDFNLLLQFINCMEAHPSDPLSVVEKCAAMYSINHDELTYCITTNQGAELEHQMALKTDSLNPRLDYVPWININDEHSDYEQHSAEFDLLKTVCKYYTGLVKPPPCL